MMISDTVCVLHCFFFCLLVTLTTTASVHVYAERWRQHHIPLSQQVRLFQSTKAVMDATVGPRAVSRLLAGSLLPRRRQQQRLVRLQDGAGQAEQVGDAGRRRRLVRKPHLQLLGRNHGMLIITEIIK